MLNRQWWVCAVAAIGLWACKGHEGQPCKAASECADGLVCPSNACVPVAKAEEACAGSRLCATVGACSPAPDGSFCRTATDADCKKSIDCRVSGACTAEGWRCVQRKTEDCAASDLCKSVGRCVLKGDACVTDDQSCKSLEMCRTGGFCTSRPNGDCGVASEKDCRSSEVMVQTGKLHPLEGVCASDGNDCRGLADCLTSAHCTALSGICGLASEADCSFSELCAANRQCTFKDTSCVETAKDCKDTPACTRYGRCSGGNGVCFADDADRCKQSTSCKSEGKCNVVHSAAIARSECAKDCTDSRMCLLDGLCSLDGANCAVLSDADCAKSARCREHQQCTAVAGECVVGPDDCKQTETCKILGGCSRAPKSDTPPAEPCVALTDDDCAASAACHLDGRCAAKDGKCVANDDGCRKAPSCLTIGRCNALKNNCVAVSAADCMASDVCRGLKCHPQNGQCVTD